MKTRRVEVDGTPTLDAWQAAFQFATATAEDAPYWLGDLLTYAETRAEWRERLDQAKAVTGLAEATLHNLKYVAGKVADTEREIAQTPAHAAEVAALSPPDQRRHLAKSRDEGWTVKELRKAVKASKKQAAGTLQRCERCNVDEEHRPIQAWSLAVGDFFEKPILCEQCAKSTADGLRRLLAPIFTVEKVG